MTDSLLAPTDPLMALAWRDCLMWAIGEPSILAAFTAATGVTYNVPTNPIDRMIDESSRYGANVARQFVTWFNENVWGDLNIVAGDGSGDELEGGAA